MIAYVILDPKTGKYRRRGRQFNKWTDNIEFAKIYPRLRLAKSAVSSLNEYVAKPQRYEIYEFEVDFNLKGFSSYQ